jgi:hypothetical protein
MARRRGITYYSDHVNGDAGNWNRKARFDVVDGYVGITTYENDTVVDRALLSPKQYKALKEFINKPEREE